MNYMSEVAKMLGVELGEEFEVGTIGVNYVLTNDGLFYSVDGSRCDHILNNILTDRTSIKRKPWKPQVDDYFWYIDANGTYVNEIWDKDRNAYCLNLYKLGNCYRTEQEAEANYYKWVEFYASDEVLEV